MKINKHKLYKLVFLIIGLFSVYICWYIGASWFFAFTILALIFLAFIAFNFVIIKAREKPLRLLLESIGDRKEIDSQPPHCRGFLVFDKYSTAATIKFRSDGVYLYIAMLFSGIIPWDKITRICVPGNHGQSKGRLFVIDDLDNAYEIVISWDKSFFEFIPESVGIQ